MAMMEPDAALAVVLDDIEGLSSASRLPPSAALGLVVKETLTALGDHPAFPRAMMDGWAVRLADAGRLVHQLDEIAAGDGRDRAPLVPGAAHPIMTGAPVPPGAEAVVPIERAMRAGDQVRLPEQIRAGENIVPVGGDLRRGSVWLERGQVVTPLVVAAAAALGIETLAVRPRPSISILATGSELDDAPGAGRIRDSNGPMLAALLAEIGLVASQGRIADDAAALAARLEAQADLDVLILTGGVSAGSHDDVPAVLERLGCRILLHKVAQRPGKPFLYARRGRQVIFALPGNPLASHLCCCRYVQPALRRMLGLSARPVVGQGRLAIPVPGNKDRTWFLGARVVADTDGWVVAPLRPASSADIFTPLSANAYLRIEPGAAACSVGESVPFTWIGTRAWP